MAKKSYSEEFRRQAVDLYETTPGATVRGIAQDLGVGPEDQQYISEEMTWTQKNN